MSMFYNYSPLPTRKYIVITRWFCVIENVLGQNSASAPWLAPAGDIYGLFTSCHIWASEKICNFYALSLSLFILWKPYSKSQPCSASLPDFRQKENSWIQSQDRRAKQTDQMSCFLNMLLNLSQFQGYPNEKGVAPLFCLNKASFLFFYMELSACFGFYSAHLKERTRVRLWAHTTVDALDWNPLLDSSKVEHQSSTQGSDSIVSESSSSLQKHFVLDINVLDFMILFPSEHVKHVGITIRTVKSGGRCFLDLLKVILKEWHDLVIRSISKPHIWRKSRLKWT